MATNPISAPLSSDEIIGVTLQDQQLSLNSHRHQNKIDAQAAEIATVRLKLNKALEENQKIKDMLNPDQLVETMTKAVSNMTMKESLKTLQGTQYKSASNYVGRLRQPQLACGSDGMLEPNVTCLYCKDTEHTKDNCVKLNNKLVHDIQLQEQVTAAKPGK